MAHHHKARVIAISKKHLGVVVERADSGDYYTKAVERQIGQESTSSDLTAEQINYVADWGNVLPRVIGKAIFSDCGDDAPLSEGRSVEDRNIEFCWVGFMGHHSGVPFTIGIATAITTEGEKLVSTSIIPFDLDEKSATMMALASTSFIRNDTVIETFHDCRLGVTAIVG